MKFKTRCCVWYIGFYSAPTWWAGWVIHHYKAQELDKAALIRFSTLTALSWTAPTQLSSASPFPIIHQFDLPATPRSGFRPSLQVNSSVQWVNTPLDMSWQGEGQNIMSSLFCESHRVLVFRRMRKILNKCYYCYWCLVTVLSLA